MSGSTTISQYFAAFLDNYFYDQVNMGSENFVKGSFSDLFRRIPTASELTNAVTMVDNNPAILFMENGDSKGDFILIVTNNHEFYAASLNFISLSSSVNSRHISGHISSALIFLSNM